MIGKPVVAKLSGSPSRFLMIKKTLTGGSMTIDFDAVASILITGFALFINDIESLMAGYSEGMENTK
jgi:hypothetical protein